MLPGWNCLRVSFQREGRFFTREILRGRDFHGINFPEGIFCGSNFPLGGGVTGVFLGKLFARVLNFRHDLKIVLSNKSFSNECAL